MDPAARSILSGVLPRTKSKENADEVLDDEVLVVVDDEELDDFNDVEVMVEVEEDDDVVDELEEVGVVLVVR